MKKTKQIYKHYLGSSQGKLVASAGLVALVLALIAALASPLSGWFVLGIVVIGVLLVALNLHDMACTLHGNCNRYAWVKTAVILGFAGLFSVAAIKSLSTRQPLFPAQTSFVQLLDSHSRHREELAILKRR